MRCAAPVTPLKLVAVGAERSYFYLSISNERSWLQYPNGLLLVLPLQVLKVDKGAVAAGLAAVGSIRLPAPAEPAAAISASLMVREESVALLPGAVQDLQDDW